MIAEVKVEVGAGSDVKGMEEVKMECANGEAESEMAMSTAMERGMMVGAVTTNRSEGAVG